jgi:hypothetical protein
MIRKGPGGFGAAGLFQVFLENGLEITGAVEDADDNKLVVGELVKNDVRVNDHASKARAKLVAAPSAKRRTAS